MMVEAVMYESSTILFSLNVWLCERMMVARLRTWTLNRARSGAIRHFCNDHLRTMDQTPEPQKRKARKVTSYAESDDDQDEGDEYRLGPETYDGDQVSGEPSKKKAKPSPQKSSKSPKKPATPKAKRSDKPARTDPSTWRASKVPSNAEVRSVVLCNKSACLNISFPDQHWKRSVTVSSEIARGFPRSHIS